MSLTQEITVPLWNLIGWSFAGFVLLVAVLVVLARVRITYRDQQSVSQLKLAEFQTQVAGLQKELERELSARVELVRAKELECHRSRQFEMQFLELQVRSQEREKNWQAELALLTNARDSLSKEFENIANKLFDQKQEQFSRAAKSQLETVILPFRDQLQEFRTRVDEAQRQDIAQHHQLMGQISELQKQSHQIGLDAVNLANALKGNNKVLGNWGELILARILEQMGLQQGREYDLQVSHRDEDGRRLQPDVVVYLPDDKDIVIDAKVSLRAYERYICAGNDDERAQALKDHVDSVRAHIRNLSGKNYAEVIKKGSVDLVCMFIPVEAAFVSAVQQAPELLHDAYDKKIVLVSPSSLFVVLRAASALWQRDRQDRNVEQIVEAAGRLYDQFVRFVESLQDVGTGLDRANKAYETAMNRLRLGNGNLVKRTEDLRRLGAKTGKNLPKSVLDQAQLDENLEEQNQ